MLAIKKHEGLRSGLFACKRHQPLIPTLFLSLIFPYSSVLSLRSVRCWAGPNNFGSGYQGGSLSLLSGYNFGTFLEQPLCMYILL